MFFFSYLNLACTLVGKRIGEIYVYTYVYTYIYVPSEVSSSSHGNQRSLLRLTRRRLHSLSLLFVVVFVTLLWRLLTIDSSLVLQDTRKSLSFLYTPEYAHKSSTSFLLPMSIAMKIMQLWHVHIYFFFIATRIYNCFNFACVLRMEFVYLIARDLAAAVRF